MKRRLSSPRLALIKRVAALSFPCLLLAARCAWATQEHDAPEGLYAHQIAHAFFIFSMGILIYWLRGRNLVRESGWRLIQYSSFLFILWNAGAAVAHHLGEGDGFFQTVGGGTLSGHIRVAQEHWAVGLFYYMAKMDHLLLVPAIVFLYLGLRHLLKHAEQMKIQEQ